MIQTILVVLVFLIAIGFLLKKFIGNPTSKKKNCGDKNCGCH
jgi:hypothetical protein